MGKYTAKQRTEVLELLRDGWNPAKIERATGVNRQAVRKWGRAAGVYQGRKEKQKHDD